MRKRHQEIYSTQENFDRCAALERYIEETNRHIGKAYLNSKASDVHDQADSWMAYLWWIPTNDFAGVFEHCVRTRTNPSSQLTLQNFQQAARDLIAQNKIKPLRKDSTDPDCVNCRGLGWEYLEVMLTPPGDEFAEPKHCTVVNRCDCESHQHQKPDYRQLVSQMMRWLAGAHPDGIPNVEREHRAAEKIAEMGYSFEDVQEFVNSENLASLVPVVRGIGHWQFQRELRKVPIPQPVNEVATIALRLIKTGGLTDAQMAADVHQRQFASQQRQQLSLVCAECGVPRENGRCEQCDELAA